MSTLTILLFFLYCWGLGSAAGIFVQESKNFFERHLMRLGLGLGIFPILSIILNMLHVPLDWKVFLLLSVIAPAYLIFKPKDGLDGPDFRMTKTNMLLVGALALFAFSFYMYHNGSFVYPWFEDSDPWLHAQGAEYISIEKTAYQPYSMGERYMVYADPYPPSYDIMLGVLHQTSPDLMWTMKFFNALIISLGILFFYLFAKQLIGEGNRALFAAFILAMVPSYLSHFIWAHALFVTLLFPCLYAFEKIEEDSRWAYVAALLAASELVMAPTASFKFAGILAVYWVVKSLLHKKALWLHAAAGIGGVLLSLTWWLAMLLKYKSLAAVAGVIGGEDTVAAAAKTGIWESLKGFFDPASGSATRAYTFNDYFIAKGQNMINNPTGLGIFITILLVLGIVYIILKYKTLLVRENHWMLISMGIFVFTFLGVNSMTFHLPIGLYAFRFWMLQAIAVSLVAAAGMWMVFKMAGSAGISKALLLVVVVIGVIYTSGMQKYEVNTALWPSPPIVPQDAMQGKGHVWLKTLPLGTPVFSFQENGLIQSFGAYSCDWCGSVKDIRRRMMNMSAGELHYALKAEGYQYAIVDFNYAELVGQNATEAQLKGITESLLFAPVHSATGVLIMRLV